MFYFFPFITAFILSIVITPLIIKLAKNLAVFDYPDEARKIHQKPTPLLGGLAIYLPVLLAILFFLAIGRILDIKISALNITAIILGGLILIIGGILDDRFNLRPKQQVIFPIFAALIILSSGIIIKYVTNPLGGIFIIPFYLGLPLTFFWLLGMMYTTKLLDGLDGLVSGVTFIGAIIIFVVSLYWDIPSSGTSVLAIILAGACLGFLLFNRYPAKIFLGESGSLFCGFMLAILAIISGSKIATALLIMGIPILDVAWVILRRLFQGKPIVQADAKHLHFRLLDIGLSHRQAVLFLYFLTATFGVTSLFLHTKGKILALVILAVVMIILAGGLVGVYKLKNK